MRKLFPSYFAREWNEGKSELGTVIMSVDEDGEHFEIAQAADDDDTYLPLKVSTYWNKVHSKFRSRVERRFAHMLTDWKWTESCRFKATSARHAMAITVAVEAASGFRKPSVYKDFEPAGRDTWGEFTRCRCTHHDMHLLAISKVKRTTLYKDFFYEKGYLPVSLPANNAKIGTLPRIFMAKELRAKRARERGVLENVEVANDEDSDLSWESLGSEVEEAEEGEASEDED